jgi:hypothetical protein
MSRSALIRGLAFIVGAAFIIWTSVANGDEEFIIRDLFFWCISFMLPISLLMSILDRGDEFFVGVFILAGISVGVLIDAAMDDASRNLVPFEILFWYILAGPPILVGNAIAWLIGKLKLKQLNHAH